jgi:hypothetical protein
MAIDKPERLVYDAVTGESIYVDMTDEELQPIPLQMTAEEIAALPEPTEPLGDNK